MVNMKQTPPSYSTHPTHPDMNPVIFDPALQSFINELPKAELHVHIEGTLEPTMLLDLAQRNSVHTEYRNTEQLQQAYRFGNLQDFLDIYYTGTGVLCCEQDFYELTRAYLQKARQQNILHTEIMFDPQTHCARGLAFSTVISGIHRACEEARGKFGISSHLILCFLRHLDEQSAFATLEAAADYRPWITAIGLDSSEQGNPPEKFRSVFAEATKQGYHKVAHAGEEGPAAYIWQALQLLQVDRIDHGNRALDDPKLITTLRDRQIPLTLCPLSNLQLKNIAHLHQHPLRSMLEQGLLVTVNSDDPAYFGGYLSRNLLAVATAQQLDREQILTLAKNSFTASFLDEPTKKRYLDHLQQYANNTSLNTP